jgi:serine/threonine-protein kinase
MVGTPSFMAPEQVLNMKVDHRADIYGAGVVLYRLLAGRPPFICKDLIEYAAAHASEIPTPPSRYADLPVGLESVVMRALEKRPDNRFASAKEMIDALAPFLAAPSPVAAAAAAVDRSPESMPTNPLPGRSVLANPRAASPARGTEMLVPSPPRGTEMVAGSPPRGTEVMLQSPPRGTEVMMTPPPAPSTPLEARAPGPLGVAIPAPAPPPADSTHLSTPARSPGRPVEIVALVVAALAVLVIAFLCAKLLGLVS